jgi:dnd system-associated protein 4
MRDIRRPDSLEPLVERLTGAKLTDSGAPVFSTIMDLLIFAAGVGFHARRKTPVPSAARGIPYRIFENNQKEGHLYLLALAEAKDSASLVSDNDDEIARIFEEYAAGGLEIISSWLNESPSDMSGVQTLLSKIQTELGASFAPAPDPSPI